MATNLKELHAALIADGAPIPEKYEDFERYMTTGPNRGYDHRKEVYDALKADGAPLPDTYEEFSKALFVPVKKGANAARQAASEQRGAETPAKPAVTAAQSPGTVSRSSGTVSQSTVDDVAQREREQAEAWKHGQAAVSKAYDILQEGKNALGEMHEGFKSAVEAKGAAAKSPFGGSMRYNPETGRVERMYGGADGGWYSDAEAARIASNEWMRDENVMSRSVSAGDMAGVDRWIESIIDEEYASAQEEARSRAKSRVKSTIQNALRDAASVMNPSGISIEGNLSSLRDAAELGDPDAIAERIIQGIPEKVYAAAGKKAVDEYLSERPEATEDELKKVFNGGVENFIVHIAEKAWGAAKERQKGNQNFLSSALESTVLSKMLEGYARTYGMGMEPAFEAQREWDEAHPVTGTMAFITGMTVDPLTYMSGVVGNAGGGWAMNKLGQMYLRRKLGRDVASGVAGRWLGSRTAGTVLGRGLTGGINFGTYETGSEIAGQYAAGEYDFGRILTRPIHGMALGMATGAAGGLIGNGTTKAVQKAKTVQGAIGARVLGTGVDWATEVGIFATADAILDGKDILTSLKDATRMVSGFKAMHFAKGAAKYVANKGGEYVSGRIGGGGRTAESEKAQRGFIKEMVDRLTAVPETTAFTEEELAELEGYGYGDLSKMLEQLPKEYTETDGKVEVSERAYDMMEQLMGDSRVSESARARWCYIWTGKKVPMSSVMGCEIKEQEGADEWGNPIKGKKYTVEAVGSNGVISRRSYDSKESAQRAADAVMAQAEANTIAIGEDFNEQYIDHQQMMSTARIMRTKYKDYMPYEFEGATIDRRIESDETIVGEYLRLKELDPSTLSAEQAKFVGEFERINNSFEGDFVNRRAEALRADIKGRTGIDVKEVERKDKTERTPGEQKALEEYVGRLYKQEGVVEPERQIAGEADPIDVAYQEGFEATTEERNDIYTRYQIAQEEFHNTFGTSVDRYLDGQDAKEKIAEMRAGGATEEEISVAIEAFASEKALDGAQDRASKDAEKQYELERDELNKTVNQDGVSVIKGILKVDDKPVYIVSGEVLMTPDGTMVDHDGSDKTIVVYNPETGEREMISPETLLRVEAAEDAETKRQEIRDRVDEAYDAEIGRMVGRIRFEQGEGVKMIRESGEPETGTLIERNEDGTWNVEKEDGTQMRVSEHTLQLMADRLREEEYKSRHRAAEAEREGDEGDEGNEGMEGEEPTPEDYEQEGEIRYVDENGEEVQGYLTGYRDPETGKLEYYKAGERRMRYATDEELRGMVKEFKPTASAQPPEGAVETEPDKAIQESESAAVELTEADGTELQAGNIIPDGMTADRTISVAQRDGSTREYTVAKDQAGKQYVVDESGFMWGHDGNGENMKPYRPGESVSEWTDEQIARLSQPVQPSDAAAETPADVAQTETPAEATAESMPVDEDGEPQFMQVTPQRGHAYIFGESGLDRSKGNQFVKNNIKAAEQDLDKHKKKEPTIGTSIAKYNKQMAEWQQKLDEAQRALDYWNAVSDEQQRIEAAEAAERERIQSEQTEAAIAGYEAEKAAAEQAEAERQAVGYGNAMPAISEKYNSRDKIYGKEKEIILPNGERVKGRYVLTRHDAPTPSHDPFNGYAKSEGFPMNENGTTINDRDYERDLSAQRANRERADSYDGRAVQNPPIWSNEGVIMSGNDRGMARLLSHANGTDSRYMEDLRNSADQYGFTAEQVDDEHNFLGFELTEPMEYTTENFAKFNAQEMKSQSNTETAVKMGKVVDDGTFRGIVRSISAFDTLGDFYNDPKAGHDAIGALLTGGVVGREKLPELLEGPKGQEKLTEQGKKLIESVLIGKFFEKDPEAVRILTEQPSMRQRVVFALSELADNFNLGKGYSLEEEMITAVKLCGEALSDRGHKLQLGDIVSFYGKQGVLFEEYDLTEQYKQATVMMLADLLNNKNVSELKKVVTLYDGQARESAAGQMHLFAGGVRTREDILKDVLNRLKYGSKQEIEEAQRAALGRRKASVSEDVTVEPGDGAGTEPVAEQPEAATEQPAEISETASVDATESVQHAVEAASAEVNVNPTPAQCLSLKKVDSKRENFYEEIFTKSNV